ncbi:MAG: TrkH family potassium uptake protein [Actinobacteria bacterium]|nr:TrkH family potassium uptake protein [Thermoleophilia bacterium]MCB9011332.1 TrkH family potassium uptake protein [Actinomycetota bacterium]
MRLFNSRQTRQAHPAQVILLGFAAVILAGTLLLYLPIARTGADGPSFMAALFTATSAVAVTGHVIVDTPTYWSAFGEAVILLLIQLGGFGVMTVASVVFLVARRRIGLRGRLIAQQETSNVSLSDLKRLLIGLAAFTLVTELILAVIIGGRLWLHHDAPLRGAVWRGVFHAVSAFNNAGFALWSDNLTGFVGDWWLLVPIALAIVIGGIGYPVWKDVVKHFRHPSRLTLHSKLTLVTSAVLLVGGALATLGLEAGNEKTLEPLSPSTQVLAAVFHSVTARTAGFNTLDVGSLHDETLVVTDMLMFIGGGSASTAGGIKVGTFAILILILLSEMRGGRPPEAFGRAIAVPVVRRALSVMFLAANLIMVATLALLASTPYSLSQCLFEVISAFSTVGLSTGITPHIGVFGQSVLIALMYLGRVGPLTLALALAARERDRMYNYPEERPLVG